jgi:hypothetical protein
MGRVKPPRAAKITVDPFGRDPIFDPFERCHPLTADRLRPLGPVFLRQARKRRLDRGAHLPAITGRAAVARIAGIDDERRAPAAGCLDRSIEAGVAGPDDQNVDLGWKGLGKTGRRR